MTREEPIIIQKRIDEVIRAEFEKMVQDTKDPLIKLIVQRHYQKPSLEEVKNILRDNYDE